MAGDICVRTTQQKQPSCSQGWVISHPELRMIHFSLANGFASGRDGLPTQGMVNGETTAVAIATVPTQDQAYPGNQPVH